ncbi:MAG: (Fe-S)-binding protein [Gemmatimonadota bacterium]
MRIALLITCFNDALFPQTGVALVRVLESLGHQVVFPPGQSCCGQVHFNTGYRKEAGRLLHRFLRVFGEADVVVAPSASCVAMVREQYPWLASEVGDDALVSEARELGARTFELSEFLVGRLGVEDVGAAFQARVALHPTCHSRRGIDVGDAPERLLRAVEGVELVDLPNVGECCGFGGTFAVKNPDTSMAMLSDKIRDIRSSGAEVLTGVDNSCLMHIGGGMHRLGILGGNGRQADAGKNIRVMHLAEILACREGDRA